MANRANHRGFGHLRRLPSGRWQASYVGPDLARHNAPSTFAAKVHAERWLADEHSRIERGEWMPSRVRGKVRGPRTFEDYATAWIASRPLKPRTREGYEHLLRRYLFPTFGPTPLPELRPVTVREWWASLDAGTPTVNARAYSLLCSWCALRIGEALELRRSDVDLDHGTIRVQRAVFWLSGRPKVGTPKSAACRRTVAIPSHILQALKDHLDLYTGSASEALPPSSALPGRGRQGEWWSLPTASATERVCT